MTPPQVLSSKNDQSTTAALRLPPENTLTNGLRVPFPHLQKSQDELILRKTSLKTKPEL